MVLPHKAGAKLVKYHDMTTGMRYFFLLREKIFVSRNDKRVILEKLSITESEKKSFFHIF